jgi:hypothetical protein
MASFLSVPSFTAVNFPQQNILLYYMPASPDCNCAFLKFLLRNPYRIYRKLTAQLLYDRISTLADMAELADAPDLGSGGRPCRFKSCYPHPCAPDASGALAVFRGFLGASDCHLHSSARAANGSFFRELLTVTVPGSHSESLFPAGNSWVFFPPVPAPSAAV